MNKINGLTRFPRTTMVLLAGLLIPKLLTLRKMQINLLFHSLNRNFAESLAACGVTDEAGDG